MRYPGSTFCCAFSIVALSLAVTTGCGDESSSVTADARIIHLFDSAPPDAMQPPDSAPPIDAPLFALQPAVGFDHLGLVGENATFATLGTFYVNGQIQGRIETGDLAIALEFGDLDDHAGQNDEQVRVGFYQAIDADGNGRDNFNAETPDRWVAGPGSQDANGDPTVRFDGSITNGRLIASSESVIDVPGSPIPLPMHHPSIDGFLTASTDNTYVSFVEDGNDGQRNVTASLRGAVPVSSLGMTPNLASALCPDGAHALDLIVLGCATPLLPIGGVQPDVDLDNDGLETFYDTCDGVPVTPGAGTADAGVPVSPDAGTPNHTISCCVDGDGTIVQADGCWSDSRFADGFQVVLEFHATRVTLLSEMAP